MNKPTVIFDFDGVINSYKSGWKGADVIPDPPVEGIKEAVEEIRKKYKVVVVSSRCYLPGGIQAIKDWLQVHDIDVDDVTGEMPPAIAQIDDRAITFDGKPETLLEKIQNFQPWYKEQSSATKTLDISDDKPDKDNISDLKTYGDNDTWKLLCKASSEKEGWMKSTKVCNVTGGCIVQVTTQQRNIDYSYSVAEALTYVPGMNIDIESSPRKLILI